MTDPEIIVILGRRGMGKSTWAKRYVQGVPRLCVWDPKRSYKVDYPPDLSAWFDEHEQDPRFQIGGFYDEDQETLGSIAYALQHTCLVLEECAFVFNPREDFPEWARECIYLGRERGVSVVAVAQRPRSVHIALRSQATRVICFNQHEITDVDWIADMFGSDALDQIPHLARLECLDISPEGTKRYTIPLPGGRKPGLEPPEVPQEEPNPSPVPYPSRQPNADEYQPIPSSLKATDYR